MKSLLVSARQSVRFFALSFFFATLAFEAVAAPLTFEQAKITSRQEVYFDRADDGTFYCGCKWNWMGRSGGRTDLASCGYEIRADANRAARIEWEHIVPASNFGRARQCWQNGGRQNCKNTDPVFNEMEADLHNLTPAIGEVNADRSNFRFGVLPSSPYQHGQCRFKVDFAGRVAEPRDEIKGQIARVYFYMHDRYGMRMSDQQQRVFVEWDRAYPPTAWERERDRRIAAVMGHHNPFVTGEKTWDPIGRVAAISASPQPAGISAVGAPIRGNTNTRVYHLPQGCPSYDAISMRNRVEFGTEREALSQGFRRAGNCR